MNTSEYSTAALGHVTNFHADDESYVARKCVKAGVTTYQLATNIRPGDKGGLAIDWVDCTDAQFSLATRQARDVVSVGCRVERLNSGYDTGRTGTVVEVESTPKGYRARVFWDGDKRTWVNFRFLKVIA